MIWKVPALWRGFFVHAALPLLALNRFSPCRERVFLRNCLPLTIANCVVEEVPPTGGGGVRRPQLVRSCALCAI